jgi:hypothetical protein
MNIFRGYSCASYNIDPPYCTNYCLIEDLGPCGGDMVSKTTRAVTGTKKADTCSHFLLNFLISFNPANQIRAGHLSDKVEGFFSQSRVTLVSVAEPNDNYPFPCPIYPITFYSVQFCSIMQGQVQMK